MVMDPARGKRPLSAALKPADYGPPAFSTDGRTVAVSSNQRRIFEVDVATGAVLRTIDVAANVWRLAYAQSGLVVVRNMFVGDVWLADDPL